MSFLRIAQISQVKTSNLVHSNVSFLFKLQRDNEICKLCSENCKLSHRYSSLLILTKTILGGF
ncbi:MAG: hypothetical protein RBQ66_08035 [Candidatus Cloacimonadaceae bacterium]|jgi:hypothetical protein|nr:hypothetical protein [Candidatus Cloacimonadaceae bacterium]